MLAPPESRAAMAPMREQIEWQVSKRPYTYLVTDFVGERLQPTAAKFAKAAPPAAAAAPGGKGPVRQMATVTKVK